MDISVVITTYNQSFETIRHSIMSALLQRDVAFELIIADDNSRCDYSDEYQRLFREHGFSDYALIRNKTNLKTVRNIANALERACAPYVKTIDAGDILHDAYTLHDILAFCRDKDVSVGFGDIVRFRKNENESYVQSDYRAPQHPELLVFPEASDDAAAARALKAQMESADWIPAAAQFYKTDIYRSLLIELSEDYGVEYCQDFTTVLALGRYPIFHYEKPIYWYEWGTGISTSGNADSRKRLYSDHRHLYQEMAKRRPFGTNLSRALLGFRMRDMVARSPFYKPALKLLSRYDAPELPLCDDFFLQCVVLER